MVRVVYSVIYLREDGGVSVCSAHREVEGRGVGFVGLPLQIAFCTHIDASFGIRLGSLSGRVACCASFVEGGPG